MKEGFRYKVEHVGDILVDNLEKMFDLLRSSTEGISLTYDIRNLEREKGGSYRKIGKRTAEIRKDNPENEIFGDSDMMQLFSELDRLESEQEEYKRKREARLNPGFSFVE